MATDGFGGMIGHTVILYAIQVRPADAHSDKETKLFIGMLPRTADEELVQSIFAKYGQVKEVHVMRTAEVSDDGWD